jgi:hypothetical protein
MCGIWPGAREAVLNFDQVTARESLLRDQPRHGRRDRSANWSTPTDLFSAISRSSKISGD